MKKMRRLMSVLLAFALLATAGILAYAAANDTRFSDVASNAWYAGAVEYVSDNGLMSGTGAATFEPDTNTSRAMLATILYKTAGSPAVSDSVKFDDAAADAYYASAVSWAASKGIVSGYGDGLFGSEDPVSREQIASILWRYAGSPESTPGQAFADESTIAAYASDAVDWARANGIVSGEEGNRFNPKGSATRAQVAAILQNYLTMKPGESQTPDTDGQTPDTESQTPAADGKTLVVYFSMPETTDPNNMTTEEDNSVVVIDGEVLGNTQYMAYVIQETTDADIFRIEPSTPYPTDHDTLVDLAAEERDNNARPAIQGRINNLSDYDTIYVGYPIWWSDMPMILYTFFDTYDFSGKTIVPFSTHGGSSFSGTPDTIQKLEPDAEILDGLTISRNSIQDAKQEIVRWVGGL